MGKTVVICKGCEKHKAVEEMHHRQNRWCIPCAAERKRGYNLKNRYGITKERKDKMFDKQKGLCAICKSEMDKLGKGPHKACLDHCHETGAVRGVICNLCNSGLGRFKDDARLLRRGMEYLIRYKNRDKNVRK